MRADTIDASGEPRWGELADPFPGPGELVLGLRWSGLCGTDLFKLATGAAPAGTVLGHEVAGEVFATGPGVSAFAPGDRLVVPHHAACGACFDCRSSAETQCAAFRENLLAPGGFAGQILVCAPSRSSSGPASPGRREKEDRKVNTKWLMSASAILMAALGLTATFLPQEAAAALGGDTAGTAVLVLQVAGGLYLGFAILNWFARTSAIGGIYNRPIVTGNLLHFTVVALALAKTAAGGRRDAGFLAVTALYVLFATWFGRAVFNSPVREPTGLIGITCTSTKTGRCSRARRSTAGCSATSSPPSVSSPDPWSSAWLDMPISSASHGSTPF